MSEWPIPADVKPVVKRRQGAIRVALEVSAATAVALGAQLLAVPEVCREESVRALVRVIGQFALS